LSVPVTLRLVTFPHKLLHPPLQVDIRSLPREQMRFYPVDVRLLRRRGLGVSFFWVVLSRAYPVGRLGCATEGYGPGMLGRVIWQETGWWEPRMLDLDSLTG
jgi:hypothetical protein